MLLPLLLLACVTEAASEPEAIPAASLVGTWALTCDLGADVLTIAADGTPSLDSYTAEFYSSEWEATIGHNDTLVHFSGDIRYNDGEEHFGLVIDTGTAHTEEGGVMTAKWTVYSGDEATQWSCDGEPLR